MKNKIAYIVSAKNGLPAFTYREIKELYKLGNVVIPFIMKNGKGLYNPEKNWNSVFISKLGIITELIKFAFTNFLLFLKLVSESIKEKVFIHFLIAIYFTNIIKKRNIDVLYANEGKHALWIGYFINKLTNIPLAVIVHAEMINTNKKRISITKKALDRCYKIITITNYNKNEIIKLFNINKEKIEVVRLFADFKEDNSIKIMIVGQWVERKGHETLLKAIQQPGLEDFKVWVVGGGKWGDSYFDVEKYVGENNLKNNVVIWGKVTDEMLQILYKNCDIFCLPSRTTSKGDKEGLPVSLMEAMFFEKPVISTYHTGIPELVKEILIKENDYEALAKGLIKLRDKNIRKELGKKNKKIIIQQYSKRNVESISKILKNN